MTRVGACLDVDDHALGGLESLGRLGGHGRDVRCDEVLGGLDPRRGALGHLDHVGLHGLFDGLRGDEQLTLDAALHGSGLGELVQQRTHAGDRHLEKASRLGRRDDLGRLGSLRRLLGGLGLGVARGLLRRSRGLLRGRGGLLRRLLGGRGGLLGRRGGLLGGLRYGGGDVELGRDVRSGNSVVGHDSSFVVRASEAPTRSGSAVVEVCAEFSFWNAE